MVCNGGGDGNRIEYTGIVGTNNHSPLQTKSDSRGTTNHPFTFGDQMEYVGYATINGSEAESQRIMQAQDATQTLTLQFDEVQTYGQPCLGTATVTDIDGNTYNTVQIGNQCWMKENLRTTRYANGVNIPLGSTLSYTDSYRYDPDNDSSNVSTCGYLYNWPAVMHGASSSSANPSGVQGICPNGWHVPSDAEWTQLTDYVRSQTQYQCNNSIAKALASTIRWNSSTETCAVGNNPSANNATGFSVLPAGRRDYSVYHDFGSFAYIWSATEEYNDRAYVRTIFYFNSFEDRYFEFKNYGVSVRCLRD